MALLNSNRHPPDGLAAAMEAVWQQSRALMAGRVSTIEDAVAGLLSGATDRNARRTAEREAHKLAGSMGTFGRHRGSELAREIESLLQGSGPLLPATTLRLSALAVDLRGELEKGAPPSPPLQMPPLEREEEILVVDADADFAHRVVEEALACGLRASAVADAAAARAATTRGRPALILVDAALAGVGDEGLALVAELSAACPTASVVVASGPARGLSRVAVSRAGGHSVLDKRDSPRAVAGALARILRRRLDARILVVDDDPAVAAFLDELLRSRGIHVEGVSEPRRVWTALDELRPDLLVLDLDLPDIDGLELCRMIRRDSTWSDLPIVFLTGTEERERVRELFTAGADDHIPKPIVAEDVVARIANRLERSRARWTTPGTALASAPVFAGEVSGLLALARRRHKSVVLAVAAVDGLDELADRQGRAAADQALVTAAKLLARSAWPGDVIGWAAERHLGLAMYEQDVTTALERLGRFLEAVRDEEITLADRGPFRVSASVGVSVFPRDGEGATALLAAAIAALRRAQDPGGVVTTASLTPSGAEGSLDVLLIDDDEALGVLLMHSLGSRGYKAEWVRDGTMAAAMLVEHKALGARVILLDVGLPGLDGLSVLRRLSETGRLSSTRVIMLTLRSSDAEILESLDLGAFDHVAKPFSLPVLLHRIRRALDSLPA